MNTARTQSLRQKQPAPQTEPRPVMMPTLLLVRPENRQAEDRRIAERAGWDVLPFAPVRLAADPTLPEQLAACLPDAAAVFWVSPTAVEMAVPHLRTYTHIVHIAVGQATAHALERAGCFPVHAPERQNDSEAVLTLPVWQQLPPHAGIVIIRGQGGREYLAEQLRLRGFRVHAAAAYQSLALPLDWPAFMRQNVQAAWVTSSEMAHSLFTQAPSACTQKLKSLLYLTHHERIARTLQQYGAAKVSVYPNLVAALHGNAPNVYTETLP